MINIAFFHQRYLVQQETISALRRLPAVRVIVIDIVDYPSPKQSALACQALGDQKCSLLFTINEWGLDHSGSIAAYCKRSGILQVNWCVDDPFFMEVFHGHPITPASNRIDFVSNRAYIPAMLSKGLNAHFLPLAADTSIFFPSVSPVFKRDVGFVGNSYRNQVTEFCLECEGYMESLVPFMADALKRYESNIYLDLEKEVSRELEKHPLPGSLSKSKTLFIVKHFISYLFRKKIVCNLMQTFSNSMIFGDLLWAMDVPPEKVSTSVGYYTNLRETYAETKINIDINRVVITEGLTQRVFDCLACNSFVITNNKPILNEFFVLDGPDKEVVTFDNQKHLHQLINYYLTHEEERRAITLRGQKRVCGEHTYNHRIQTIFSVLSNHLNKKQMS